MMTDITWNGNKQKQANFLILIPNWMLFGGESDGNLKSTTLCTSIHFENDHKEVKRAMKRMNSQLKCPVAYTH